MSKKGATKTGGTAGRQRNRNQAMAAYMAQRGEKRTTFRDPITNKIRQCGEYPGMKAS